MTGARTPARVYPSEDALRIAAVEVARFACNGDEGRVLGDPVFEMVTEGRNKWRGYSACGDLAQYLLAQLGVRDERLVNRNDDGGVAPWKIGMNLSRIVYASGKAFVWARPELRPKPGDILYVALPEHVCVLEHLDERAGEIATFDYGQWNAELRKPAGRRRVSRFAHDGKVMRVGQRTLRGWLDLAKLPGLLAQ